MLAVVLDVNVVVSAVMSRHGPPRRVLEAWQAGSIEVLTSSGIIEEVAAKLLDPAIGGRLGVTTDDVQVVVQLLRTQARLITPAATPTVTGDPEDDHVLSATLEGSADYLVTGGQEAAPACPPRFGNDHQPTRLPGCHFSSVKLRIVRK